MRSLWNKICRLDFFDIFFGVILLILFVAGAKVLGHIAYTSSIEKAAMEAYNECLKTMSRKDAAEIQMFCEKLRDKL